MGILPLVDTIAQSATGIISQAMQNRANRKLAEYSYQKDVEMWNTANEYNNPKNQMARLESAGLNPNLVYGSGSVAGNTSPAQTPKYQQYEKNTTLPVPRVSEYLNVLSQFQDYKTRKAQAEGISLDNEEKKIRNEFSNDMWLSRSLGTRWDAENKRYTTAFNKALYPFLDERVSNQLKGEKLKLDMYSSQMANMWETRMMQQMENDLMRLGATKSDNPFVRYGVKAMNMMFPDLFKPWGFRGSK